jgi:ketosteroid isomerase-like protein
MVKKANKATAAVMLLLFFVSISPCPASLSAASKEDHEKKIIAIERSILERWAKGDPFGYMDHAAPDITFFDPPLESRGEGVKAFRKFVAPAEGKVHIPRYEMINPRVQLHGEIGVLTYNLVNYSKEDKVTSRWNSTEVYRRIKGEWKLIHSHWSLTKPKLARQ